MNHEISYAMGMYVVEIELANGEWLFNSFDTMKEATRFVKKQS